MRGLDEAAPDRQRRADDLVDLQRLERERDADDLADRVDGADLVEVDVLGRDAVDAPLGDREALERVLRALLGAGRELRGVDLVADRRPVAVRLPGRAVHVHGRRVDPVAIGLPELDAQPVDAEVGQLDRRARVDQRAEQHVARDAADAVDVEHARHE